MGAALGAAIWVARASTNASPPQEKGNRAHERNTADNAVGGEGLSLGFQWRAHWDAMIFRVAASTIKAARSFSWNALRDIRVLPAR